MKNRSHFGTGWLKLRERNPKEKKILYTNRREYLEVWRMKISQLEAICHEQMGAR